MLYRYFVTLVVSMSVSFCAAATVYALPFNEDMVDSQLHTGTIMRPAAEGTLAKGEAASFVKDKAAAEQLENPVQATRGSISNGSMLFGVNCSPCHGDIREKTYVPGPVAVKFIPPPDITVPIYADKSDGYFYGVIEFGGLAVMPRLGWKLSADEKWNIVNYIRSVQKEKQGAKE